MHNDMALTEKETEKETEKAQCAFGHYLKAIGTWEIFSGAIAWLEEHDDESTPIEGEH